MTEVKESVRIDVTDGQVVDSRVYSFPDGWDKARVHELLNKHGFEQTPDHETLPKVYMHIERDEVLTIGNHKQITHIGTSYHLPDGWDVERVRDLLREHGFRRIDNRQDSMSEPHPFD